MPPRRRLPVGASTAARTSAKVCACLRPGPKGWRRSRQRAPLRAAPSRVEVLIAARDDRLGRVLGEAQLAEDLGGERVGNGEHAEQDAPVPERPPVGVVERVGERLPRAWVTPRQPPRVCSSAPGPNFSSRRSRTASKSIPSVAGASRSILGRPTATHGQSASSTASALPPSCRRTAVAPAFRSRISTNNRCSVPT